MFLFGGGGFTDAYPGAPDRLEPPLHLNPNAPVSFLQKKNLESED